MRLQVVADLLSLSAAAGVQRIRISGAEHPLESSVHLLFLNELSPIGLSDALSDRRAEALVALDKFESRISQEIFEVCASLRSDLRQFGFLFRSKVYFHGVRI